MAGPAPFRDASVIAQVAGADTRDLRSALVSLLASGDIEVTREVSHGLLGGSALRPLRLTARGESHATR